MKLVSFKERIAARKASEAVIGGSDNQATTLRALGFKASSTDALETSDGESFYLNGTINGGNRVTVFFKYWKEDFRLVDALASEPKAWVAMLDKPANVRGNHVNVYPSELTREVVDPASVALDPKVLADLAKLIG